MNTLRRIIPAVVAGVWLLAARSGAVMFHYSVDIGGDLEYCDPNADGDEAMDPAWIYRAAGNGHEELKTDTQIWGFDPPPTATVKVPYGQGSPEDADNFFDIDGEDQLAIVPGEPLQGGPLTGPVAISANPAAGLFLNPPMLYYSLDDDGAPGWWAPPPDVPVKVTPDNGAGSNEVLRAQGWRTWPATGTPTADETLLGLAANPPPQENDDDVDALDTRLFQYWFWTCDHEANYGLDPGAIYRTDRLAAPNFQLYIPPTLLGLAPGTDVDAIEFCVTDNSDLLQAFGGLVGPHLAVVFSVDQDDPTTLTTDESGGLNPNVIYISLLSGAPPVALSEREGDVDAIALDLIEHDWGDAPDGPYPTLLTSNGARHRLDGATFLGAAVDEDLDGQPDPNALGDDNDADGDDEDGVVFTSPLIPGQSATITVVASVAGYLDAWIDFGDDGSWAQLGDQIFVGQSLVAGVNNLTFAVPAGAAANAMTFARFRFSTIGGLSFTGGAPNGEVEDYEVAIDEPQEPPPPAGLKWVQYPDLSFRGMDVEAMRTYPYLLADDFLCTNATTITNVVVWGSWWHDILPEGSNPSNVVFFLSFHADIPDPDGQGPAWSMPGTTLWTRTFSPGSFKAAIEKSNITEGWYNPANSNWTPNADWTCWRYEFPLDPSWAFAQTGTVARPIVYWLNVQAMPMGVNGAEFGWKTSTNHWNDDACWVPAIDPYNGLWWEMRYPVGHPLHPQSIDLAFALYGGDEPPPPPAYKWWQHPDLSSTGMDVHATARFDANWDPTVTNVLADDFRCHLTGPITNVIVWGSWFGDLLPSGNNPNAVDFVLTFHKDIPAGVAGPYSRPGQALWSRRISGYACGVAIEADQLEEGWYDPATGYYIQPGDTVCWRYEIPFPEPEAFVQTSNTIYWLSVQAYPHQDGALFGWKSSTNHWNDDAVWGHDNTMGGVPPDGPWYELRYPPTHPLEPQSVDLAFALKGSALIPVDDFGDAPDPGYPTLRDSNGARHGAGGPWFGGTPAGMIDAPDPELNGQPDPTATGDNLNGANDENGVIFPGGAWVVGLASNITVYVGSPAAGLGYIWFDWNADGDWNDSSELVYGGWLNPGANVVSVTPPIGQALAGTTFARFRIDSSGYCGTPTGYAPDGEVEDHAVTIEEHFDYGDAPVSYPTLLASNGACHVAIGPSLGAAPDWETDGQPNPAAKGDDGDGFDDEDGATLPPVMIVGVASNITVAYTTSTGAGWAYVMGWIDWNGDGDWDDSGENVIGSVVNGDGVQAFSIAPPVGTAVGGSTFLRLRISTDGNVFNNTGVCIDGEVEDYLLNIEERFDYGDAPVSYPTLLASNGACHIAVGPSLGAAPDWEADGQPGASANGDDSAGVDDEDGVAMPAALTIGVTSNIIFTAATSAGSGWAYVTAWIDWNGDGDWADSGESVLGATVYGDGAQTLVITPPWDAVPGPTFIRFRISTDANVFYNYGLCADGEVEDYIVALQERFDYGDAPDPSYPTLRASDGARHVVGSGLFLGTVIDSEADGQQSASATGDDLAGLADEDGITFTDPLVRGSNCTVTVVSSSYGYLSAWVDWNVDGDWSDSGERAIYNWYLAPGTTPVTVTVPADAAPGPTLSRFRLASSGIDYPSGPLADGEVEDYRTTVYQPQLPGGALAITNLVVTNTPPHVKLEWSDVGGMIYQVQSTTNLVPVPVWTNASPTLPNGYYFYTNSAGIRPVFYRITVPYSLP